MSEDSTKPQEITLKQAVQNAVAAGCKSNSEIKAHVIAATGRSPSPTTLSLTRKSLGLTRMSVGRPRKTASPKPACRDKPCAKADPLDGISAVDLIGIAKAIRPFVATLGVDRVLGIVKHAVSL